MILYQLETHYFFNINPQGGTNTMNIEATMNQTTLLPFALQIPSLQIVNNQPVLTSRDIDAVHSRIPGTTSNNFRRHRSSLTENQDYFFIKSNNLRSFSLSGINGKRCNIFFTESGYVKMVGYFIDPLAFHVKKQVLKDYFHNDVIKSKELTKSEDSFTQNSLALQELINKQQELIEQQMLLIKNLTVHNKSSRKIDPWIEHINQQLNSYGHSKDYILRLVYSQMLKEGVDIEEIKKAYKERTGLYYVSGIKAISKNEEYKKLFMDCLEAVMQDKTEKFVPRMYISNRVPDVITNVLEPFNLTKNQRGQLLRRIYSNMENNYHINLNQKVNEYPVNVSKAFVISQDPHLLTLFKESANDIFQADKLYQNIIDNIRK